MPGMADEDRRIGGRCTQELTMVNLPIRLAMRVEGDWWVAYLAHGDTMDKTKKLGSVLMGIVQDPERKRMFMDLMTMAIGDAIKDKFGQTVDWVEQSAPESEWSGSA